MELKQKAKENNKDKKKNLRSIRDKNPVHKVLEGGMGSLCFFKLSKYPRVASFIFSRASPLVFPCEIHPGKEGHSAMNIPSSSRDILMNCPRSPLSCAHGFDYRCRPRRYVATRENPIYGRHAIFIDLDGAVFCRL